jgi:hypothetical protein
MRAWPELLRGILGRFHTHGLPSPQEKTVLRPGLVRVLILELTMDAAREPESIASVTRILVGWARGIAYAWAPT